MTHLNFISVIARGLNIPHKRTTILEYFSKKNVDIAMIQETHLLHDGIWCFENTFYHPIAFSSAPMLVVCKHELKFDIIGSWADIDGQFAIDKIGLDGKNIALTSAYDPNTFDAGFYDLLTKILLSLTDFQLVLGADFNAVWDCNIERTGKAENRDQCPASDALHH